MKKQLIYIFIWTCFTINLKAQTPVVTSRVTIQDYYDNIVVSSQNGVVQQLIGSYQGWDPEAIFIGGYNALSVTGTNATKRIFLGGPYSGTNFLSMDIPSGNLGLNVINPQSYYHGGNNKVFEIFNPNAEINSQAHLILSNNSVMSGSSAGSVSWMARNAQYNKGMAYIGAQLTDDATNDARARLIFATANGAQPIVRMAIDPVGNVGIGTTTPNEKLSVNGKIRAHEIKVETANWPDYVFEKGYKVGTLEELESYIKANKHLPEMPAAKEIETNGLAVGEVLKLQQKKIEELTLHLIEKDKALKQEQAKNQSQEDRILRLEALMKIKK